MTSLARARARRRQMSTHDEALEQVERIANEIVAPSAARIDKAGEFPGAAIAAMGEAGLLGLISATAVGGRGLSMRTAAMVVERLSRECASTGMVVCMHYSATAVLEQHGPESVRKEIAAGRHLTTLAFSELGSRGQFWAPVSSAARAGDKIRLDAKKSFVTSARAAHSYVWSSKPLAGAEASTLWLVPRDTAGVRAGDGFDGLGLRGNDSSPVTAENATIDARAMLGDDGAGFGIMMGVVLPWFNVLAAAVSVGIMETATARTAAHAGAAKFEHAGSTVADLATVRAFVARMRIKTDCAKTLLFDTVAAIEGGRPDATLRVLESKAAAGELATEVADLAMRVCGGAAFRKDVGVERGFRDARASLVMAPTTDMLFDFIGKAVCGLPLF
jgi:alkylation response protein AidB-like acyl-CoA dehydrogenase